MKTDKTHYNSFYFNDFQKKIGKLGGEANKFKFEKHIRETDTVLDFGSGGGFLLNNLTCKKKIGVEINDTARDYCKKTLNIECYKNLDEIKNNSIDIVISNHCLEHCSNPDYLLSELFKKLKRPGKIIISVPLDSRKFKYEKNDINFHLYSFSPMNLGNLLFNNGFEVLFSNTLYHKWPPKAHLLYRIIGFKAFNALCYLYGRLNFRFTQTIAIGLKA
jgi:SAM-dependent methyltransferase